MAHTAYEAWTLAESRCAEYLQKKLKSAGSQAFLAEAPDVATRIQRDKVWWFAITGGGGDTNNINSTDKPPSCIRMDAAIEGMFHSRTAAQRFSGLAFNNLPAGQADIVDILILGFNGQPSLERGVIGYDEDSNSEGGEHQTWVLTIPLFVVFKTQTA